MVKTMQQLMTSLNMLNKNINQDYFPQLINKHEEYYFPNRLNPERVIVSPSPLRLLAIMLYSSDDDVPRSWSKCKRLAMLGFHGLACRPDNGLQVRSPDQTVSSLSYAYWSDRIVQRRLSISSTDACGI